GGARGELGAGQSERRARGEAGVHGRRREAPAGPLPLRGAGRGPDRLPDLREGGRHGDDDAHDRAAADRGPRHRRRAHPHGRGLGPFRGAADRPAVLVRPVVAAQERL
ncbi:MAG: hypothetical protein AVDCRST_MAG16-2456, partial [uncultured Frankineae bacterium]